MGWSECWPLQLPVLPEPKTGVVALAADGSRALVGAPGDECGRTLLFAADGGWLPAAELQGSAEAGSFGHAVALDGAGGVALVGAPATPCVAFPSLAHGAAFAFEDLAVTAVPTAGAAALVLFALSLAAAGAFVLRRL